MVAANVLMTVDDREDDGTAMAMAYDAVYQSFQPLMLLARRVVEYDKANKKEQVPEHMAADVAAALRTVAERTENATNPEFWLGDTSKRAADAQLVVVDADLAELLMDSVPLPQPLPQPLPSSPPPPSPHSCGGGNDDDDDDDLPLRPTHGK